MTRKNTSRNALDGKIIHVRQGVAVYKVKASPYYRVRVWIPSQRKRVVKSTKADNRAEAISAAEALFASMGARGALAETPKGETFEHFADLLVQRDRARGEGGEISKREWKDTQSILRNASHGLVKLFGHFNVAELKQAVVEEEFRSTMKSFKLAPSTMNRMRVVFTKVMKLARSEGLIEYIPPAPRIRQKDNPRSFFRFHPLVSKKDDEYRKLLRAAKEMARKGEVVRGIPVTEELHDFIVFLTNSFLRPTISEVYSLTHQDVAVATKPKRLVLTIKDGKTGYRISNTMESAVYVYDRICSRHPKHVANDFLFLPEYKNRDHAKRIFQRQFKVALERAGLLGDRYAEASYSIYSLRHTAICMRLLLSQGEVNTFLLAKNAGTSVDQIERFYAKTCR